MHALSREGSNGAVECYLNGKAFFIFGNGSCLFVLRILGYTIKYSKKILKYYLEIGHNRFHSHPFQFVALKSSYHLMLLI